MDPCDTAHRFAVLHQCEVMSFGSARHIRTSDELGTCVGGGGQNHQSVTEQRQRRRSAAFGVHGYRCDAAEAVVGVTNAGRLRKWHRRHSTSEAAAWTQHTTAGRLSEARSAGDGCAVPFVHGGRTSGLRRCVRRRDVEETQKRLETSQNFSQMACLRDHLRPTSNSQVKSATCTDLYDPNPDHDPNFRKYGPRQLKTWDLGRGCVVR